MAGFWKAVAGSATIPWDNAAPGTGEISTLLFNTDQGMRPRDLVLVAAYRRNLNRAKPLRNNVGKPETALAADQCNSSAHSLLTHLHARLGDAEKA
jgi:hypothetical protein